MHFLQNYTKIGKNNGKTFAVTILSTILTIAFSIGLLYYGENFIKNYGQSEIKVINARQSFNNAPTTAGAVYEINNNGTFLYSTRIDDAISKAKEGATITFLKSCTDNSTAIISKNLTLNTNNQTLTRNKRITVKDNEKGKAIMLAVKGNGGITYNGNDIGSATIRIEGNSNLAVYDYPNLISTNKSVLTSTSKGTITLNGGYYYGANNNAINIGLNGNTHTSGVVTIKNCFIYAKEGNAIAVNVPCSKIETTGYSYITTRANHASTISIRAKVNNFIISGYTCVMHGHEIPGDGATIALNDQPVITMRKAYDGTQNASGSKIIFKENSRLYNMCGNGIYGDESCTNCTVEFNSNKDFCISGDYIVLLQKTGTVNVTKVGKMSKDTYAKRGNKYNYMCLVENKGKIPVKTRKTEKKTLYCFSEDKSLEMCSYKTTWLSR